MRAVRKSMIINCFIRVLIGISTLLISGISLADQIETSTRFRLHLVEDPGRILPQYQSRSASQYLVGNLFDSYYRLDGKAELKNSMMKSCIWKTNTRLVCTPEKRKWANGQDINAEDYFEHLKRQLDKDALSSAKELFSELLNYKDYLSSKVPFSKVGLKLNKSGQIEFRITKANRDFLYNLTHPVLSPIPKIDKKDEFLAKEYATGPYKLKEWKRGRSLLLERNSEYPIKIPDAPLVEFFVIPEYYTALNFYEKGNLDFLRRFPLENLARFQNTPQLVTQTLHRFDYIGFGPEVRKNKELGRSIQTSYDGAEFQRLMSSPGKVGCVSISDSLQSKLNCLELKTNKKLSDETPRLKLHYAKQAGENVARGMQWFQQQWKKNLNLKISLISEDWKYLESQLTDNAPDLFRKGVPLSRPTCLAALEVFESNSPDNYIKLNNKKYDQIVSRMRMPKTPDSKLPSLCSDGIKLLMDSASLIPLGEMTFYMLSNGKFKGFTINKLNQLDLSRLTAL